MSHINTKETLKPYWNIDNIRKTFETSWVYLNLWVIWYEPFYNDMQQIPQYIDFLTRWWWLYMWQCQRLKRKVFVLPDRRNIRWALPGCKKFDLFLQTFDRWNAGGFLTWFTEITNSMFLLGFIIKWFNKGLPYIYYKHLQCFREIRNFTLYLGILENPNRQPGQKFNGDGSANHGEIEKTVSTHNFNLKFAACTRSFALSGNNLIILHKILCGIVFSNLGYTISFHQFWPLFSEIPLRLFFPLSFEVPTVIPTCWFFRTDSLLFLAELSSFSAVLDGA